MPAPAFASFHPPRPATRTATAHFGNPGRSSSGTPATDLLTHLGNRLDELAMDACRPGWDGYGAEAVTKLSYQAARSFLEAIPAQYRTPDITTGPDGWYLFEWSRGPRRSVLVAVDPDYAVHYAGLFGQSKMDGIDPFFGQFPSGLKQMLARLYLG